MALRDEYDLDPVPEQGAGPTTEQTPGRMDDTHPAGYFKGDIYGGELWAVEHYEEASRWEQEACRPLIPAPKPGDAEVVGYRLDDKRLRFPEHCTAEEKEAGEPLVYADRL